MCRSFPDSSQAGTLQQAADDFLCGEIFGCDLTGRTAVASVIALDGVHCRENAIHVAKAKQSLAGRQKFAEARLSTDHRSASSQVTSAPIAEPPCARADVLVTRDSKLAT